ncbi:hypothetical protein DRJ22_04295 [Candidatus Woesearchaeota archaeon]|nr:MAG: hypothetical protein B6U93_03775 [Candidatus Woesearchaeota archaeon ex4484_78]RLE45482.1 MAG: hypothetical protein DRJ22_04295 [Candidatus Woesearchaeota archaeon]
MGKKRLILDTNVIISAFGWKGKPRILFERILNKDFEFFISNEQLNELKKVLEPAEFLNLFP